MNDFINQHRPVGVEGWAGCAAAIIVYGLLLAGGYQVGTWLLALIR